MKITTDSKSVNESKDPKKCSVFQLFECFASDTEKDDLAKRYLDGGLGYGEVKQICFEKLNNELKEPRKIFHEIRNEKKILKGILESGRDKARVIARQVTDRVREKVGI